MKISRFNETLLILYINRETFFKYRSKMYFLKKKNKENPSTWISHFILS